MDERLVVVVFVSSSLNKTPRTHAKTQAQESLRGAKTLLEHALRVKERVGDAHGHALCKALARTAVANAVGLAQTERALQGGKGEDGQGRRLRVCVGMAWTAHKQLPVLSAAVAVEEYEGGMDAS